MFTSQNTREIWRRRYWSAVVLIIICFSGSGVIAGQAETFFTDAPVSTELYTLDKRTTQDPAVIRSRYAIVNLNLLLQNSEIPSQSLDSNLKVLGKKMSITLNLFPGISYIAIKDSIEFRGAGRYSWFGHINGIPLSQITLVANNGLVTGNIRGQPGELYQIRPIKNSKGIHGIYVIDQTVLPSP